MDCTKQFSGDPPLPVAWLTPATSHREIFLMPTKLLFVDHDEPVRRLVGRVLASAGFSVALAGSGSETLARFRTWQPEVVVLELAMPDLEGTEVCHQLGRLNPRVPVVLITASPRESAQARQQGASAVLEKPLDLGLLLETIRGLLTTSQAESGRIEEGKPIPA